MNKADIYKIAYDIGGMQSTRRNGMNKADVYKTVYDLMSDVYECEGANSPERTLGEIMGVMSMALEIENMAISEKPTEHDGCVNCKWTTKDEREQPCMNCKHNYLDQWEKRDE